MSIELDADMVKSLKARRRNRKTQDILIVEDDRLSRGVIKKTLDLDYQIHFATDGASGVAEYVSKAPDVLFLDIGLPDMSGHDVLNKILEVDKNCYVVMLTGRKDEKNVLKALEIGAQGYVIKPFSRENLEKYIEKSPYIQEKQDVW